MWGGLGVAGAGLEALVEVPGLRRGGRRGGLRGRLRGELRGVAGGGAGLVRILGGEGQGALLGARRGGWG